MRTSALLAALLVVGSPAFGVDPRLMHLVMPDAKVLAGVNVTSTRASPFGEFLFAKKDLLGDGAWKSIGLSGFDPAQDVSEVLAATPAWDLSRLSDLVLVSGTFNVDKIVSALSSSSVPVTVYRGNTLLRFTDPKGKTLSAVAFIGSSIAISGDVAAVQAAIDRSSNATNTIDSGLLSRANELSAQADVWTTLSASTPSTTKAPEPSAPVDPNLQGTAAIRSAFEPFLKSLVLQSQSYGMRFGADVQLIGRAVAGDAQKAAELYTILQVFKSLGPMARSDPKYAQAAELMQVFQGLKIDANGPEVSLALSIPETRIEMMFNQAMADARPKAPKPVVAGPSGNDGKNK